MSTNFPLNPYDQQRHWDGTCMWTWYEQKQTWKIEEEFSFISATPNYEISENN